MDIALSGNSPSTLTAGIMLLTRARQLGFPMQVVIVGDPSTLTPVPGPAVVYAPVLASCGVGRELGSGATVVVPGPPGTPLRASIAPHGTRSWFLVDRANQGHHPATKAFLRLCDDPRRPARALARDLRRAMEGLGMGTHPGVLDVLFGVPAPPLLRLALALRMGRAMGPTNHPPQSLTRWLSGRELVAADPLDEAASSDDIVAQLRAGELDWISQRLAFQVRDAVDGWIRTALTLARDDGDRDIDLLAALLRLASHLAQLPVHSILPPLGAAEDSVAVALKDGLLADGEGDAARDLLNVYRFLGGRFVDSDPHPRCVSDTPAPRIPATPVPPGPGSLPRRGPAASGPMRCGPTSSIRPASR